MLVAAPFRLSSTLPKTSSPKELSSPISWSLTAKVAAAAASLLAASCASGDKPLPTFALEVTASEMVNPYAGEAKPVLVKILQLSAEEPFATLDHLTLANSPEGGLGDTLVASDDVLVTPGVDTSVELKLDPDAEYLAAFGLFRTVSGSDWRAIVPVEKRRVPLRGFKPMTLSVAGTALTLETQ